MTGWFGMASHGIAALVYAVVTAMLIASHPGDTRARWLLAAVVASALWALGAVALLAFEYLSLPLLLTLDALHMLAWTAYAASWLAPSLPAPEADPAAGSTETRPAKLSSRVGVGRGLVILSAAAGLWALIAVSVAASNRFVAASVFPSMLCMALIGLLTVEQLFRNARKEQRRSLWLLCLAAGGVFVIHLFVYSQATLLDGFVSVFWESRGIAVAALAPLLVFAVKRQAEWERELFVSRQVTFYTASLLGVGGYLLLMSFVAYVIRAFGGQWGLLLEIVFLAAAAGLLVVVLRSSGLQTRAKVFIVKHFYRNKYDYRHEWLRLTEALGSTGDLRQLARSALNALANIAGARVGALWLERDAGRFDWITSLDPDDAAGRSYRADHPLVQFLTDRGWVVDSHEYARDPDRYDTAFDHPDEGVAPQDSIVVPLDCMGDLLGFAVLSRPNELGTLNFEDHDILKTAGRQIAIVLAQALAQQQLLETRQFEAMNKLSTFLMHDLKNVVAQQELLVANAQRFRDRPEFVDDMVTTVKSSVERMRRVLDQLQHRSPGDRSGQRTDIWKVLIEVRSHCADREPVPKLDAPGAPIYVSMDRDKLSSVVTHLVRNAQDATGRDGSIELTLRKVAHDTALITVSDTGCGMDPAFVRDRLFRPFDSTKGAKGMGIGAYQVRETVRLSGGDVEVRSEVGVGTEFQISLPISGHEASVRAPAAGDDRGRAI